MFKLFEDSNRIVLAHFISSCFDEPSGPGRKMSKEKYFLLLYSPEKQRRTVKWFNWILKICPKYQLPIFSLFWGRWLAQWAVSKNCAERKYFDSDLCPMRQHVSIKGSTLCSQEFWCILSDGPWPQYSFEALN